MKRSIATVSLSGTLPEKLEAAAAAGFDGIELFENDLLYHSGSPQDIRRRCEDLGRRSRCSSRSATSRAARASACSTTSIAPSASSI